jgi:SnoaL-like domain
MKDWNACRAALADDFVITTPDGRVINGADAFVDFLNNAIGEVVTVHHCHMPEIELTSTTTAKGTWLVEDLNRWPDGRELHG